MPRPYAIAGHRLVFSVGILYLSITAGALLIEFDGITVVPWYLDEAQI